MISDSAGRGTAVRDLEGAFLELMVEFRRYYAAAADQISPGLAPGTFRVLVLIDRMGPTTVSAISEHLSIDKGLISRHVTELERFGLVDRVVDEADRRIKRLATTSLARQRLEAARVPYELMLSAGVAEWPVVQISRLSTLLTDLTMGLRGSSAAPEPVDPQE